jgi:hypothetical protein
MNSARNASQNNNRSYPSFDEDDDTGSNDEGKSIRK